MEPVFLKLVNMSITASYLVLAVIAWRQVFRKTPKWILCALWGMVALRLIFPFTIESALSLIPSSEPLPSEIIYTAQPEIQSGIVIIDEAVNPVLESSLTPVTPAASASPTQVWSFILSRVWILGVMLMLVYALVSYLIVYRKVATAIPISRRIKRSEFIDTPFILGLIRPKIYLPSCMDVEDIPYVIAHEQAHLLRHDHWWKPLGFLLLSVYWFNPVMWLAYILLCRDIEAACDEKVIRDMEMKDRRAYSTALLNCSIHRRTIAACPLAFGEVGVKQRIKSVMHYKKPAFWMVVMAILLGIVVAVCFLTNPKKELNLSAKDVTPKGLMLECKPGTMASAVELEDCYLEAAGENGTWREVALLGTLITMDSGNTIHTAACEDGWALDWTANYGILPPGEYRIGATCHDREKGETQTQYTEFSIEINSCPYVWFDQDGKSGETPRAHYRSIRVPGMEGVTLTKTSNSDFTETLMDNTSGEALVSGQNIRSAVFADLSGDGVCELYAAVDGCIQSYDWQTGQQRRLLNDNGESDSLVVRKDCLFLLRGTRTENDSWGTAECFQLMLTEVGILEATPLEPRYQDLTGQITGISLLGRKLTSLNREQIVTMENLLQALDENVEKAPRERLAAAREDSFELVTIHLEYALGYQYLNFAPNHGLIWCEGSDEGYLLSDPEPLRNFMEQLTEGVINRETSGAAFATAQEPWNWAANISADAVVSAKAYVCLEAEQADNVQYSSSTNGIISQQTLDALLSILNAVPADAFSADKSMRNQNFLDYFSGFQKPGCSFAVLDNVNNLAASIHCVDGKVKLLLTGQTEQFDDRMAEYLTDAQLWIIDDPALQDFMQQFQQDPTVIYYTVGAQYTWQGPLEFQHEDFSLNLWLIEGWEYETVPYSDAGHTGIRCRPPEVTEGWLYFSYWPDGYAPEETDRLVLEGLFGEGPYYTSYPSTIGTPNNFSTKGAIWSYQRTPLSHGDYAVINDGADSWFQTYRDQIEDTVMFAAASIW